MTLRHVFAVVITLIVGVLLIVCVTMMFENLDAGQVMVIQSPVSGNLTWYTTPGVKWQGFGKVTKYQKRSQFWFSSKPDQGKKDDESLRI